MMYKLLIFMIFSAFTAPPVDAAVVQEEVVSVKADGFGLIKKANRSRARNAAIQNAFSKALKRVVATIISEETIKQNHTVLDENIYSISQAFVQNYSVIQEKAIGNMYQLSIKVDIAAKRLRSTLAKEGLYHFESKMPKVLLIVAKQDAATGELLLLLPGGKNKESKHTFEGLCSDYLEEAGFELAKLSDDVYFDSNLFSADELLNDEIMEKIGANYDADLVSFIRLLDNSLAYSSEDRPLGPPSALITAKVIDTDTGELVFSVISKRIDLDPENEGVLEKDINSALMPLMEKMSGIMASKKIGVETSLSNIHMTVSGLKSYDDYIQFQKVLEEKLENVDSIEPRGFSSGKAALDVTIKGTTKNLADSLTMVLDAGFNLDIIDYGVDYILLKMKNHNP